MSSHSINIVLAAALMSVLFMHACDTTEPGPHSVNVSPRTARLILVGDTVQLSAEVRDRSGSAVPDVVVNWSSGDTRVATVTATGLVTAVSDGTATVAAEAGDARGTAEITVEVDVDRTALIALYQATDGLNWTNNEGWLSDLPLAEWHGVYTDASGRVSHLVLGLEWDADRNEHVPLGLKGRIPPEIGNLDRMRVLSLTHNRLTGPIPPEIGKLGNLEALHLTSNRLTGPIPPEIGDLAKLTSLTLERNQVSGPIPPEIGKLANLEELYFRHNNLSGPIPPEIGDLGDVTVLDIKDNNLSGPIPPEIGELANLTRLELNNNALSGSIPSELADVDGLTWLDLSANDLSGEIPSELADLERLRFLRLSDNGLTGPIPPAVADLDRVTYLNLSENDLSGAIPSEIGGLDSLGVLDLSGNGFSDSIPPEIGDLAELYDLDLSGSGLSGSIPPEIASLTGLRWLDLSDNALDGPVPAEIGDLSALRGLHLGGNDLEGPVPPGLGGLAGPWALVFEDNPGMAGTLPGELTALEGLDVFLAGDTDLCAPPDSVFQTWLGGIPRRRVKPCADPPATYLVQAVQSREYAVPLVAGDSALLRVFVTAQKATTEGIPDVRARFYLDDEEDRVVLIPGKSTPIPTAIDESSLDKSANAVIPGGTVQPGLEVVIEIDPDGTLDPDLGVPKRIPETGRLAVEVRELPTLDLTLIPFIWTDTHDSSIVDLTEAMAADPDTHELLEEVRTLLPVGGLEVTDHDFVFSTSNDAFTLLRQTRAIRVLEGDTGHYKGMMVQPVTGARGVAYRPGRSSFSVPAAFVLAHELGHNMNLRHAPCGDPPLVDIYYPHPEGSIGVWGYDFRDDGGLVAPSTKDVMSYCVPPDWISDYHFTNALRFRLSPADSSGLPDRGPRATSLLLWGGLDTRGKPFLEPAFVVDAPRALPGSGGEYRLAGHSSAGTELFTLSFDMPEVADGGGATGFAFVLPVQSGWAGNLARITLSGPGGSVRLDGDGDLGLAIVRDPRSGQVRAILRDGVESAEAQAEEVVGRAADGDLEVLLSRGIPGAWRR